MANNWQQYQDIDAATFAGYDDDYLQTLAENLVDVDISAEDLAKYMPQYDQRGEDNIRQEMKWLRDDRAFNKLQQVQELGGIGQSRQDELLGMAQDRFGASVGSGFTSTGNPMIDRQRRNIYQDISEQTGTAWAGIQEDDRGLSRDLWRSEEDIYQLQEDYQQKFAERLIKYEDRIEAEEAAEAAAARPDHFNTWTWQNNPIANAWDETIGVGGIVGGINDIFDGGSMPWDDWTLTSNPVADVWDATGGKIGKAVGDLTWICGAIKKAKNLTKVESLKMAKFMLKAALTYPLFIYWYMVNGKAIRDAGNKLNFNWGGKRVKNNFVTKVLKLEESGNHEKACRHYYNSFVKLAKQFKLDIEIPLLNDTIIDRIIGYRSILNNKKIRKALNNKQLAIDKNQKLIEERI
tara:strand:- start:1855 stop:3072 length:1218 start_codon:yes stop_codon:yes gene_type:complete